MVLLTFFLSLLLRSACFKSHGFAAPSQKNKHNVLNTLKLCKIFFSSKKKQLKRMKRQNIILFKFISLQSHNQIMRTHPYIQRLTCIRKKNIQIYTTNSKRTHTMLVDDYMCNTSSQKCTIDISKSLLVRISNLLLFGSPFTLRNSW